MTEEAERYHGPPPRRGTQDRSRPRPTGTLAEILADLEEGLRTTSPAQRLHDDLTRIEGALARLERALKETR